MPKSFAPVVLQIDAFMCTYEVRVLKGVSISIARKDSKTGAVTQPRVFSLGDMAEYDSYNLSYYAPIVSITEKTVSIGPNLFGSNKRLTLEQFCYRNFDFDLERTKRENSETMHHI